MDNFNALSKSAILTKLALDGYFIDLLTLNSFIKEWQIEAIYENEFGIEFFDNNSYLTILDKLKAQYNKTKKGVLNAKAPELKKQEAPASAPDIKTSVSNQTPAENNVQPVKDDTVIPEIIVEEKTAAAILNNQSSIHEPKDFSAEDISKQNTENKNYSSVSLEDLTQTNKTEQEDIKPDEIKNAAEFETVVNEIEYNTLETPVEVIPEETIMPPAMKNLKPGPVSPNSTIVVDHSYIPPKTAYTVQNQNNQDDLMINESFTVDEIEKANNLINKANHLPESITETYFDTGIKPVKTAQAKSEPVKEQNRTEPVQNQADDTKNDELDLVQLAQSFAQNFTGGDAKDVPPADLEQIFTESYTDSFSELQDYVQDEPAEYTSLQEDLPSDIIVPEVPKTATHFDSALASNTSNLNADDIRSIIREEITRQTASIVPVPQNNENVKEILREIVKQTADVVPQNAFKLDISQGTLDMIAKTIAKKIAIKLNGYYKLNSSKQNEKLQLFRQRTIELKEKNQMLADENRKLKARLLEANSNLESYKPAMFGLFKYTGRKRR